jgi:hypothetical protein
MIEVPYPEIADRCPSSDHWVNLLMWGVCWACKKGVGIFGKANQITTMPKLIITRSFSKTKQIGPYEPVNAHCSLQVEYEHKDAVDDMFIRSISQHLDILARHEVERTIESEVKRANE